MFDSKILVRHPKFGDPIADWGKQFCVSQPTKAVLNDDHDGANRTI